MVFLVMKLLKENMIWNMNKISNEMNKKVIKTIRIIRVININNKIIIFKILINI